MGYPVLTLDQDGKPSQARFLALGGGSTPQPHAGHEDIKWNIPIKVVWDGDGGGDGDGDAEMSVLLTGEEGGGEGGRKLMEAVQRLQAQGKWYKVHLTVPAG